MTKTEKKIDNAIRGSLTLACNDILGQVAGFEWLTHQVDFKNVEKTLRITCIFETQSTQSNALFEQQDKKITQIIISQLAHIGLCLSTGVKQIRFDNEERCLSEHDGNWARRLAC